MLVSNSMDKSSVYEFSVKRASGEEQGLDAYRGKVLLVVNVASQCGFTPQYEGLEALYKKYHDQGFEVLGFPCNQFGAQEPGTNEEIQSFCQLNFGVTFPVFGKIDVNGKGADPLYQWLTREARGVLGTQAIKWNFTKFLIGRDGQVLERFASTATPASLEKAIESALSKTEA